MTWLFQEVLTSGKRVRSWNLQKEKHNLPFQKRVLRFSPKVFKTKLREPRGYYKYLFTKKKCKNVKKTKHTYYLRKNQNLTCYSVLRCFVSLQCNRFQNNRSNLLSNLCPPNIYLFKVNNRNTSKRCEICSKLTIKTLERR